MLYLYKGNPHRELETPAKVQELAEKYNFEFKSFSMVHNVAAERRPRRKVKIGLIQNAIVSPTTDPTADQSAAIREKLSHIIEAAYHAGVNVLCLQEAWAMPFAFATREKKPWLEFAEDAVTGVNILFIRRMAKKYNMVIVCPILGTSSSN